MDIKSFVLGYNAGASRNGGNGDQHVILTIAMDSWSETRSIGLTTWITSAIPLDDVTRQTMIRLSALDTETAADWSAGRTGAEITYNEDAETYSLRIGVIGARPTGDWRILMETATVEETEGVTGPWVSVIPPVTDATDKVTNHNYDEMSHPELREQIENNRDNLAGLVGRVIDRTVSDLVNYYTKSQTLTKDEINALVSAIPQFDIEVVTYLPTSNISETTVYLVKSGDDDTNLYTEYIHINGKWEKLGTQTVDLTGYATEVWVNDILASYVKTVDMESYVTEVLNGYLTKEEADNTYLTPATGDQRYPAKQATETALTEHSNKITQLEEALENATIEPADSVEWLEANGDTAKKYSLPDGYIYAWMEKLVDVKHNANDGKGTRNARCGTEALTITDGVVTSAPVVTQAAAGCFITWPIDVKPESKSSPYNCTISGIDKIVPNYYDRLIYLHYYKTDGTCITFKNDVAIGIASAETALPLTIDLAAPIGSDWDNVRYIRITIGVKAKNTSITVSDIAKLVINIPALDHPELVWGWHNTGIKVNDDETTIQNTADIADLKERMGVVEDALGEIDSGPLFAKLGLIGDSLTAQEYQGWQALTVSMLGSPELHKNAIVGSCVATYEGYPTVSFVDRYLETPEDCDCVVIMGGTNDATYKSGNDMGTVGVLNNNTFIGAYSTIIEGLLTRNPATRVMLMTPPRSYTTNYEERTATKLYAEATVEVAKYYGLPCLDFYDTLGWNAVTAPWCARDFTGEATGRVDTLHFSDAIGPRVGRMVANFIKTYY